MYTSIFPKATCKKKTHYQRKNNYSNPYGHLRAFIGIEGITKMMDDYETHMKKKKNVGQKLIDLKPKVGFNEREKSTVK